METGAWRQFLLAGLLAGSAMACKYPALVSVVIPLGGVVAFCVVQNTNPKRERGRDDALPRWRFGLVSASNGAGPGWSCAAGFGLGVLIAVGPWLVKNLIETGNPVYPLAYRLFDGPRLGCSASIARWRRAHSPSTFAPASLAGLALEVAFRSSWVSPLLVGAGAVGPFATRWRRSTVWLWCYVAWLFFSCWLFTHRIDRFWIPLLPVVALLAGAGAAWWWSEFPQRWGRTAFIILLAAVGLFQLAFITDRRGLCGYNDFLRDLDEASIVGGVQERPGDRVFERAPSQGSESAFGRRRRNVRSPLSRGLQHRLRQVNFRRLVRGRAGNSRRQRGGTRSGGDPQKLADEGITHIYVNWLEILRLPGAGELRLYRIRDPRAVRRAQDAGDPRTGVVDSRSDNGGRTTRRVVAR